MKSYFNFAQCRNQFMVLWDKKVKVQLPYLWTAAQIPEQIDHTTGKKVFLGSSMKQDLYACQ